MFNRKLILCSLLLSLLQVNCLLRARKCYNDYGFGTCVVVEECQHLATEILMAGYPTPSHIKIKLAKLTCVDQITVCCVPPHDTYKINPRFSEAQSSDSNSIDTERKVVPNKKIPDIQNHPNLGLLPINCGMSISSNRIHGGTSTQLFEMPWMALLSYQSVLGAELKCGGTLISEWYVLTAAHCLVLPYGLELKHVILGEYDINRDPDCDTNEYGKLICAPGIKTIEIAETIRHTGYNKKYKTDDIGLIRLSEPADFTLSNIKPICLPLTSTLQKENLVGLNSVVAGWGITEENVTSSKLLKVYLPIMNKENCQAAYKGQVIIHDQQLCAGGDVNKDSCSGDSGGPLSFPGKLGPDAKVIQRGIVSYGTKQCGIAGFPGVYTNVAYYMDWILDHMHS